MKKVLMLASVPSMIGSFNMNNILILKDMGYEVHVACNFKDTSIWTKERTKGLIKELKQVNVLCHQIEFSRSPSDIKKTVNSYYALDRLIGRNDYSFVHCHTPLVSAMARVICHKHGIKVIYTAHGFHFYKGAPIKNWLLFYPIEWICSWWTDVLITINKEDYKRAKRRLHAKKTTYVPGVGIDTDKFASNKNGRERIREELGLKDEQTMILSVGELNDNKNHISVIRAIKNTDYVYVIVGRGDKKRDLEKAAKENNVDLRLLGYREDVADIYNAADVYVLPSKREGLNVSLMEAMASGLPVACSRIRGNVDLIESEECLFNPTDIDEIKRTIQTVYIITERIVNTNLEKIRCFDLKKINKKVNRIYEIIK